MRTLTIAAILIALSYTSAGAYPTEKRLHQLLTNSKYEKCLNKCDLLIQRNKDISLGFYYKTFIQFTLFKNAKTLSQQQDYLKATGTNLYFAIKTDTDSSYFNKYSLLLNEINDSLLSFQSNHFTAFFSQAKDNLPLTIADPLDKTSLVMYNKFPSINIPSIYALAIDSSSMELSLRNQILERANNLLGRPYKYAGMNPQTGFDCSGFVKFVYQGISFDLPHKASLQARLGKEISAEEAEPGDLVFFGYRTKEGKVRINHSGIIYSTEKGIKEIIHSGSEGVQITASNTPNYNYWFPRIISIRKLIPEGK